MQGLALAKFGGVGSIAWDGAGVGIDGSVTHGDDDSRGPDIGCGAFVDGDKNAVLTGRVVTSAGELNDVARADERGEPCKVLWKERSSAARTIPPLTWQMMLKGSSGELPERTLGSIPEER